MEIRKNTWLIFVLVIAIGWMSPVPGWANRVENPHFLTTSKSIPAVRDIKWPETKEETQALTANETLYFVKGTSQVFRFDRPVARISISDPNVIDVVPVGPDEMVLVSRNTGRTNLILWDESGQTMTYDVQSIIDTRRLSEILQSVDPSAQIEIIPFDNTVAIFGFAETNEKVEEIEQAALAFDSSLISFMKVQKPKQILLEVRFAEVDRTAAESFEFDFSYAGRYWLLEDLLGGNSGSRDTTGTAFTAEGGAFGVFPFSTTNPANASLGLKYTSGTTFVESFLDYLITKSVLKLIARPNLLAKDGEQANFLVGGETPYITSNNNSTNVEYKPFGTRLTFTPEVLKDGVIRLKTDTEISELDFTNTVSLQGTTAPTIIKTQHSTVAEVKENHSLVIGGLMTQRISKANEKVPVLGDIPIIRKLFSGESFSRKDVELLIVITPRIVEPYLHDRRNENPFPPGAVEKAVETFYPAFPDQQADTMNLILTQDEKHNPFEMEDLQKGEDIKKGVRDEIFEANRFAAMTRGEGIPPNLIDAYEREQEEAGYIDVIYESELAKRADNPPAQTYVPPANASSTPHHAQQYDQNDGGEIVWEEEQMPMQESTADTSSTYNIDPSNDDDYLEALKQMEEEDLYYEQEEGMLPPDF